MSTEPLPEPDRQRLEALVRDEGEAAAVRKLAIPKNTLSRALARLPLRAGSILVIKSALERQGRAGG